MKYYYLICLFSISGFLQAQSNPSVAQFAEVPETPFAKAISGAMAFADVDGDGDQDVLITGDNSLGANTLVAELYTNDGTGEYTKVAGTPFDAVKESTVAFADVNGDGDLDVLITGQNSSSVQTAKLYQNNGSGVFSEVSGTPFEGVLWGSTSFSDIDGDGDQDVIITGRNSVFQIITKLYTNNGSGVFTVVAGTPFEGVRLGSSTFEDVDDDGDSDLLITGLNSSGVNTAKLYTNNGSGIFTEVSGTSFTGVSGSSAAFEDVDGDGDPDLLIIGGNSFERVAKLYINDGAGVFMERSGTPFEGVSSNNGIAFADVDSDGNQDVLLTGLNISNQGSTKLYSNDGSGFFTLVDGVPFENTQGFANFSDVDNDGDPDLLLTGLNDSNERIAKLYSNNGRIGFTEVSTAITGSQNGSIAFTDMDGDGDQDVLITGFDAGGSVTDRLYRNDGSGGYTYASSPIDAVRFSSIAFEDVNGDGNEDLLVTGFHLTQYVAQLYIRTGSSSYTKVTGTPFEGVRFSSIAFSDIDDDGDSDLLISGENSSNEPSTKLYTNNGSGVFTEVVSTPFLAVSNGALAFSDVDGDGDEDVLISGYDDETNSTTTLYTNNGSGVFSEVVGTPFDGINVGSVTFSDVDSDGDSDVLITGHSVGSTRIAKLYTNNGVGVFTEFIGTPFDGVAFSSAAFSDVDGDGDEDVLITGFNGTERIACLYENNGSGIFTKAKGLPFTGVFNGQVAFSDVDNNGSQDVLITGLKFGNQATAKLFLNTADFKTPSFTSLPGATFEENGTGVAYTATADEPATFTLATTKDESLFTVANGNEISFIVAPDFENPLDGDMDNNYVIDIIGEDPFGNSSTLEVTITVTDLDEFVVWNGSIWSNGTGPSDVDNVRITGDFTGGFECANLEILAFNTMTVSGESTLEVNGMLTNNGTLTIESGSSLITYAAASFVGNAVTIKRNTRYMDGKYSFVGTPVEQNPSHIGSDLGAHVYRYNETKAYGLNEGLSRWEDASADPLIPGKGYTQANQKEIVFAAVPNVGTITYNGTYTEDTNDANEGWNLVANPYAASINVGDFLTGNANIEGAVYIWDDNGSDIQRGTNADYIVANGSMATNVTPAGGQSRYNQHIGSAQGFFVKLSSASNVDVDFTESMRVTGNNADGNFFRKEALPIARLNLTNVEGLFKQTVIGFAEDASEGSINRTYDAQPFNAASDNSLFTLKAGRALALNGMPKDWQAIQLQLNTQEAGTYQISVELEGYNESLYLKDNLTGELIDLREGSYSFNTQSGIDTDRFELISSPSNVLGIASNDVRLYSFEKTLYVEHIDNLTRTYQVFNINGKQMLNTTIESKAEINLSHLPLGMYLVFDGLKTHKIILK